MVWYFCTCLWVQWYFNSVIRIYQASNSDFGIFRRFIQSWVGGFVMFYDRLQLCCAKSNTTVTALLKSMGLSSSKGTAWKNGSIPKADVLHKVAAALHTTPAYLLGETDDPSEGIKKEPAGLEADGLSDEDRELIEAFRAASPEKRRAILELLK